MPRIRVPESDEGRLQLFDKTVRTGGVDAAANRYYVPADLLAQITALVEDQAGTPPVPGFRAKVLKLTACRAATAKEGKEADAAEGTLEVWMRDFWEVLKRRTYREGHAVAVLNFFDLPQDGSIPALHSRADRHLWAQKIVDGEAEAVKAGFPAMANPSAAQVQQKLQIAEAEAAQVLPKSREEEDALAAVRAARPQALALVDEIIDELRHRTRKLEPGTARDIMRSYGVTFEYLAGETPDPEETTPAAGATPPPASGAPPSN